MKIVLLLAVILTFAMGLRIRQPPLVEPGMPMGDYPTGEMPMGGYPTGEMPMEGYPTGEMPMGYGGAMV